MVQTKGVKMPGDKIGQKNREGLGRVCRRGRSSPLGRPSLPPKNVMSRREKIRGGLGLGRRGFAVPQEQVQKRWYISKTEKGGARLCGDVFGAGGCVSRGIRCGLRGRVRCGGFRNFPAKGGLERSCMSGSLDWELAMYCRRKRDCGDGF